VILGVSANLAASIILAALAFEVGQLYIAFIAILFGLASPGLYVQLYEALRPGRRVRTADEPLARPAEPGDRTVPPG
jgi:hypothetical protein